MAIKTVLLGVILVPLSWSAPREAGAKELRLQLKYSGATVTRETDTNHDGIHPGLGDLQCQSNLGRCTAWGVGEAVADGQTTCPNGNPGLKYRLIPGTGHGITRFDKTGDMIFTQITEETACYDVSTGLLVKSGTDKITGGTGRFAGATGETKFQGSQWLLYIDAEGNAFAAQNGTVNGTITLRRE